MSAMRQRPFAVNADDYPFADHWFERHGTAMHYVDEGSGRPVVLLHGNPTWSFLYRDVIKQLGSGWRCIAPDYPGFGFSEHPPGYRYTPQEHAAWVSALLDQLALRDVVLVIHDWGGPIGLSIAVERPATIAGIVICNTWCWAPGLKTRLFSLLLGGPLGKYLILRHNFFARWVVPFGIAQRERRRPDVLRAYTLPFPTPATRQGTYVFPRAIRAAQTWVASVEARLHVLRATPVEMVWAMRDPAFGTEEFIARWHRHFPAAPVDRLEDAAHYLQEDRPDRVVAAIRRLGARLPQEIDRPA